MSASLKSPIAAGGEASVTSSEPIEFDSPEPLHESNGWLVRALLHRALVSIGCDNPLPEAERIQKRLAQELHIYTALQLMTSLSKNQPTNSRRLANIETMLKENLFQALQHEAGTLNNVAKAQLPPMLKPRNLLLEISRVDILQLSRISQKNMEFDMELFVQCTFRDGAKDEDLTSDSEAFPLDVCGRPTFRPSAKWFHNQLDFSTATKPLQTRMSNVVTAGCNLQLNKKVKGTFYDEFDGGRPVPPHMPSSHHHRTLDRLSTGHTYARTDRCTTLCAQVSLCRARISACACAPSCPAGLSAFPFDYQTLTVKFVLNCAQEGASMRARMASAPRTASCAPRRHVLFLARSSLVIAAPVQFVLPDDLKPFVVEQDDFADRNAWMIAQEAGLELTTVGISASRRFPALAIHVKVFRSPFFFLVNIALPASFFSLLAVLLMLLPVDYPPSRLTYLLTLTLTVVAYKLSTSNHMPEVTYLTTIDKFQLWSAAMVLAIVFETVGLAACTQARHQSRLAPFQSALLLEYQTVSPCVHASGVDGRRAPLHDLRCVQTWTISARTTTASLLSMLASWPSFSLVGSHSTRGGRCGYAEHTKVCEKWDTQLGS